MRVPAYVPPAKGGVGFPKECAHLGWGGMLGVEENLANAGRWSVENKKSPNGGSERRGDAVGLFVGTC